MGRAGPFFGTVSAARAIWVVDDDPDIRIVYTRLFEGAGYRVVAMSDGREVVARLREEQPLVVILDVEMPHLDGWETLQHLRRAGCDEPVLMATNVNHPDARVQGLEFGADDYVGKPCPGPELIARVRALLRRTQRSSGSRLLQLGELAIDLAQKTARGPDGPVRLTRTEHALLAILAERPGRPVSRAAIMAQLWEGAAGNTHALDTLLWRLRRKLGSKPSGEDWIANLPGIGYLLAIDRA